MFIEMKSRARLFVLGLLGFLLSCSKQEDSTQTYDLVPAAENAPAPERYRLLFGSSLAATEKDLQRFLASLPYDSISLERTPCFGKCPVYNVTFYRNGRAEYEAVRHLPKLGKYAGEIDPFSYGRLCYLIENSRFERMVPGYAADWTDDTECIVRVKTGSDTAEVGDYGQVGPIELWAIQEVIDGLCGRIEWKNAQ